MLIDFPQNSYFNEPNQGSQGPLMMKTIKHWTKKLKKTLEDEGASYLHGLSKLIFYFYLFIFLSFGVWVFFFILFYFILLFICAYKAWVISPPTPTPSLTTHSAKLIFKKWLHYQCWSADLVQFPSKHKWHYSLE
jgi:hypothetical protein